MKRPVSLFLVSLLSAQFAAPLWAEPLTQKRQNLLPESRQENFLANLRLIKQKNEEILNSALIQAESSRKASNSAQQLIAGPVHFSMPASDDRIVLEANYVLASQFLSPGDPANGAINNVYGAPTWVVPRENALAILNLIESADATGNTSYLDRAALTADYLVRVQDQTDGGWFDQYDHANPVALSKSPTQTAEVMIAFFKLGYSSARYDAMKKGAQFLLACQDPANKTGQDDGLLGGGKDANGNFYSSRWASDNSFAYLAMKAMQAWAAAKGDLGFASQAQSSAARILNGINQYLYINDGSSPDFGVWKRVIDGSGAQIEPDFHEWINYAPQMLDLPAIGVGSARVGQWIHDKFQREDGAVVWDDTWHTTRKSPGFSFQAMLVWNDLGQAQYSSAAMNWAVNSGLWQKTPDENGVKGGWIDWTEPNDQAPFWQRFIDTSFYAVTAFRGAYNFRIGDALSSDLLWMRLQDNAALRNDFNLLYGTSINSMGHISASDMSVLVSVVHDPAINPETFFSVVTKAAGLYRSLQASASYRADFNLLFASALPLSGAPSTADRGKLFDIVAAQTFNQASFLPVLTKTASLYRAVSASASYRADFNLLFGTHIILSGSPNANDRTLLFGVAGDPAFNQALFLPVLTKTAALYRILQTNAVNRTNFNLLYGTHILVTGTPSAGDRAMLFGVAGTAGYVQATYLAVLTKAANLYRAFQTSAVYRADFNLLYGANLLASGSPNAVDRTQLFGVAGTLGFNQVTYLPVLRRSSSLYSKLLLNTPKRLSFNSRYHSNLPPAGSPVAHDRTVIFSITGTPGYNEAAFLASL